jgi:hypothetical protein
MGLSGGLVALAVFALVVSGMARAQGNPPHLIPMPRVLAGLSTQPLTAGVQMSCSAPCDAEDAFAIADLKTALAAKGVAVNASSPVNILVARYGSALSQQIYKDSLKQGGPEGSSTDGAMPEEMKAEGYVIIPDGKGLAVTAASAEGIFYALQTVKQLVEAYPGRSGGQPAVLHTATIRDWPTTSHGGR